MIGFPYMSSFTACGSDKISRSLHVAAQGYCIMWSDCQIQIEIIPPLLCPMIRLSWFVGNERIRPRNVGQVSTDFSLGSQTSFNDMGSSISPQVGVSSGTNPFNTRSVSFSETERMSSEAGNEPVDIEQYEDVKIQLKRPP